MVFAWLIGMLAVQLFAGIGLIYLSVMTYARTEMKGWWYVRFVGGIVVTWSFLSILLQGMLTRFAVFVDTVAFLLLAVTVSATMVRLLHDYDVADEQTRVTVENVVLFSMLIVSVTILLATMVSGSTAELVTGIYVAASVLLLPALHAGHQIVQQSQSRIAAAFLLGPVLLFLGNIFNLYAAAHCAPGAAGMHAACGTYIYRFVPVYDLPLFTDVLALAVAGPVIVFSGILFWGYGHYLFHHYMLVREYIVETVDRMEAVAGREAVQDIATAAAEHVPGVTLTFTDEGLQIYAAIPFDRRAARELKDALIQEFGEYLVPTDETDFEELMERLHATSDAEQLTVEQSRLVAPFCPIGDGDSGQAGMCLHERVLLWSIAISILTFAIAWFR